LQSGINNFLDHWPRIKKTLKGKNIFLFLDYDGTLTPIVDHPARAVLAPETKAILERLNRSGHCRVVIVSGRALLDLKEKVEIRKMTYIGNHGFEILGPGIHFESGYFTQTRKIFDKIIEELRKTLITMPEVLIEDKRITLSIHVRRLDKRKKPLLKRTLFKIIEPYVRLKEIYLREGKEVYELRPPVKWDKGKAVLWFLKDCDKPSKIPIYIGDDQTDEDAFVALKDIAITVHVGEGQSAAQYFIESPGQVKVLLEEILMLKNE
jgi:alpha,alpha-trehalase